MGNKKPIKNMWFKNILTSLSIFLLMPLASASTGMAAGSAATLAGSLGILVSLGIENIPGVTIVQARIYYRWISFGLIMIIGYWIDQKSSSLFCIFACVMAALTAWFGWFTVPALVGGVDTGSINPLGPWALIIFCFILSIAMYMGDSKRKQFGVSPTGDPIITIIVYLMFLQVSIALINNANIFSASPTAQVATPPVCGGQTYTTCYLDGNTQLSNLKNNTVTGGIMNGAADLLVSGVLMGWQALIDIFYILVSVAAFPLVITSAFPILAGSPPAVALLGMVGVGIWILEILTVFRWLFKPMPGEGKL